MTLNNTWKRWMRESMKAPANPIAMGTTRKKAVHNALCRQAVQKSLEVNIAAKLLPPTNWPVRRRSSW